MRHEQHYHICLQKRSGKHVSTDAKQWSLNAAAAAIATLLGVQATLVCAASSFDLYEVTC